MSPAALPPGGGGRYHGGDAGQPTAVLPLGQWLPEVAAVAQPTRGQRQTAVQRASCQPARCHQLSSRP
eukprot:10983718-Prorocentrum_lima.AAC.1